MRTPGRVRSQVARPAPDFWHQRDRNANIPLVIAGVVIVISSGAICAAARFSAAATPS